MFNQNTRHAFRKKMGKLADKKAAKIAKVLMTPNPELRTWKPTERKSKRKKHEQK